MLPLIARGSQEVLLLVPDNLREAADALGVSRWRTVLGIVLPSALGGIVTSTVLAVARAAGETAPLIFATSVFDPGHYSLQPVRSAAEHPGDDLPALRRSATRKASPTPGACPWSCSPSSSSPASAPGRCSPAAKGRWPHERLDPTQRPPRAALPSRVRIRPSRCRPATPGRRNGRRSRAPEVVFDAQDVSVFYGSKQALTGVTLRIRRSQITALIGPSGCGKTTFLRSLNRMNDSVPSFRIEGQILYHGHDIYGGNVDQVEVRRRIGMVFQKPNPFPKSIYDNIAWAPRNLGLKAGLDERVEKALRGAALWDEVKDRLKDSALGLSGGQQQRLCIARAIAIEPDVLLLDEPASALDPIATGAIEELMHSLKGRFTIVIVTHNMQQAARVADRTAFFSLELQRRASRSAR